MDNKALLQIAAQMLDLAADEFANHGCNDLYLEPTTGNINLVKEMITSSDDPKRTIDIMPKGTKSFLRKNDLSGKIYVYDAEIMAYCSKHLKNVA